MRGAETGGIDVLDAIDAMAASDDPRVVVDLFEASGRRHGYDVAALGVLNFGAGRPWPPMFYLNTWPARWFELYAARDYASADLLVREARRRVAAFTWDEAIASAPPTPREREVFETAREFGWFHGFAVPIHGPDGYLALASLAGGASDPSPATKALLRALALAAHDRLLALDAPVAPVFGGAALTRREIDCLACVALGLTDEEIGARLGVAASTAHEHVERAKRKLKVRSRARAAAVAVMRGLVTL